MTIDLAGDSDDGEGWNHPPVRNVERDMRLTRVVTVAAVAIAVSCTTDPSPDGTAPTVTELVSDDHVTVTEPAPVDLPTGAFVSSSIEGDHPLGDTPIRLSIDERHLSIVAACNAIDARYRVDGSYVFTEERGIEAADCGAERLDQDAWLERFVSSGLLVVVNDGQLVLSNSTNSITFDEA